MAFILKTGTKVQLAFEVTDVDGNALDTSDTVWESSDPAVVGVDDSGSASDPVGAGLGTATITATSASAAATAVLDITTVAGDAAVFNITVGTPEPR